MNAAHDNVRARVANVVTYFKQASYNRLPFEVIETAAKEYFGDPAKVLMDLAYTSSHLKEKRASDKPPVLKAPLNLHTEPFTLIKAAIDAAEKFSGLKKVAEQLQQKAEVAKTEELRPFSEARAAQPQSDPGPWAKEAADLFKTEKTAVMSSPAFGAAVGTMLGRTIGDIPKTKGELVEDEWLKLEDPEHENELRKIKAHTMLNQLMTDPDEPISSHDPDKILSAYNEIAAVSPRVADNIATLRPQLRKKLEGHQEPFETKELLDIEQGINKARTMTPNTSILGEGPDKLLG
jgi:hypothetical protein